MEFKVHHKKQRHSSIFNVFETRFQFEQFNGEWSDEVTYFTIEKGPAVAIVVVDVNHKEVILVKQFRLPTKTWMTEVVAGVIDPREEAHVAAKREVFEEIGYKIENIQLLKTFYTTPGLFNEKIYLFLAEVNDSMKVHPGGGLEQEQEDLEIVRIKLMDIESWLEQTEELDAKTIIALQQLTNFRHKYL